MENRLILVIDDEEPTRTRAKNALSQWGARVITAATGQHGLCQFHDYRPNLVLLDICLPDMSSWEVCHRIRSVSTCPLILLAPPNHDDEIAHGLDLGADGYLVKPLSARLLQAQVRALLRPIVPAAIPEPTQTYDDGYLTINPVNHHVQVGGKSIHLTPIKHKLLTFLLGKANTVLTYQEILEKVLNRKGEHDINQVHVYISQLRRKLEKDPKSPHYLVTEHGTGYRFKK